MVTNANWLCSCSLRGPVGIWTWSFWWLTLRNLAPFLSHCQWHMKKKKKKQQVGSRWGGQRGGWLTHILPCFATHMANQHHDDAFESLMRGNVSMTMLSGQHSDRPPCLHQVLVGGCWSDDVRGNNACSGCTVRGVGWTGKVIKC